MSELKLLIKDGNKWRVRCPNCKTIQTKAYKAEEGRVEFHCELCKADIALKPGE